MENNNNEQEVDDIEETNNGDDILEIIYLIGRKKNEYYRIPNPAPPHYTIPNATPFRLVIDPSIEVIDDSTCSCCHKLTEVIFHEKVTKISQIAFGDCSNLQRVELPEGLLRLETCAFIRCKFLRKLLFQQVFNLVMDSSFVVANLYKQ